MSKRAVIYARYSSGLQKETSIEDQVALCRRYADRKGWDVVEVYTDVERTGRNIRRPGFQAMKAAAAEQAYDVVIVEVFNRLTRKIADALNQYEVLTFHDIALHSAKEEGKMDFMNALFSGFAAQNQSEMIGLHTRRGQQGALERGQLHTSAYGYRKREGEGLNREIDPEQAAIVLRIFGDYASGKSALSIAKELNAEGVPGPRGGAWDSSTIRGNPNREEGILRNRLYIGIASVCKTTRTFHPETGVRKSKPSPDARVEKEFPELRIIPQNLWDRVQEQQKKRKPNGNAEKSRRKKYLLSGLLTCGCCGGNYVKHSSTSYKCNNARKGACNNTINISRKRIEARVFRQLKTAMLSPELEKQFEAALKAERKKLANTDTAAEEKRLELLLREAEQGRANIFRAIESGAPFETFRARAAELEAQIKDLTKRLARAEELKQSKNRKAPDAKSVYAKAVAQMDVLLSDPDLVDEAHDYLSELIQDITLLPEPGAPRGLNVTMTAGFASLLAEVASSPALSDARQLFSIVC